MSMSLSISNKINKIKKNIYKIQGSKAAHGDGADSAGLGTNYPAEGAHVPLDVVVQDELGHLSGLPTASLPTHHHYLAGLDELDQLLRDTRTQGQEAFSRI